MFDDGIREQSILLCKEQASRLKLQNRQLELRDEQIRFLKETMLALQQEKDAVQLQNSQYKLKLRTMATEINQYNINVVQKIYDQNQQLLKQLEVIQQELQLVTQQRDQLIQKFRQSEAKLQGESNQKKEILSANQALKESKSKQEKRIGVLEKENKDLYSKNISLQRQLDQSSSQISFCSQQIDVLTQKHHEAVRAGEKRIRQAAQKTVPKEDFERLERQIKDITLKLKQIRTDFQKLQRQNQRLRFDNGGLKEKLLNNQIKQETKCQQLKTDFANLYSSIKIGKRVAQFESEQHQIAAYVYEAYRDLSEKLVNAQASVNIYAEKLKQTQIQLQAALEHAKFTQVELQRLKEAKIEEEECLEAQYQQKLMEINLRLKKEEVALAGLKRKEDELQQIKEQREKQEEQNRIRNEAMIRTIDELKKENFKLAEQLTSAVRMCEGNLLSRECVSHYKYVVQELVTVIYYLHLHLIRSRERSLKLFKPFINYYLTLHPKLALSRNKYKNPIIRFRAAVCVLVAIFRMRKQRGKGKSLEWYSYCAFERRQKMENLNQHIQLLSNTILGGKGALQIIKSSQNIYKWKVNNYKKVKLPVGDDCQAVGQCQINLEND